MSDPAPISVGTPRRFTREPETPGATIRMRSFRCCLESTEISMDDLRPLLDRFAKLEAPRFSLMRIRHLQVCVTGEQFSFPLRTRRKNRLLPGTGHSNFARSRIGFAQSRRCWTKYRRLFDQMRLDRKNAIRAEPTRSAPEENANLLLAAIGSSRLGTLLSFCARLTLSVLYLDSLRIRPNFLAFCG